MAKTETISKRLEAVIERHRAGRPVGEAALSDADVTSLLEIADREYVRTLEDRPVGLEHLKPFFSGSLYRVSDPGRDEGSRPDEAAVRFFSDVWAALNDKGDLLQRRIEGDDGRLTRFQLLAPGITDQRSEKAEIVALAPGTCGLLAPAGKHALTLLGRTKVFGTGFVYSVQGLPKWLRPPDEVPNTLQPSQEATELVLVTVAYPHMLLHTSGAKEMALVVDCLREHFHTRGLGWTIDDIDGLLLRTALTGDVTSTLYLKGFHAPTQLRPNNKNYTGPDVRHPLEPARDSTYDLSYARCRLRIEEFIKPFIWFDPERDDSVIDEDFLRRLIEPHVHGRTRLRLEVPVSAHYRPILERVKMLLRTNDGVQVSQPWRAEFDDLRQVRANGGPAPFEDAKLSLPVITMGVSLRNHTVDDRRMKNFIEYARKLDMLAALLTHTSRLLNHYDGDPANLWGEQVGAAILGRPLTLASIVQRGNPPADPYEVDLALGDLEEGLERSLETMLQDWDLYGEIRIVAGSFDYKAQTSQDRTVVGHDWYFEYEVFWEGVYIAAIAHSVTINSDASNATQFKYQLNVIGEHDGARTMERLLALDIKRHLVVRFHSGHVLRDGQFYLPAVSETFFAGWEWKDLGATEDDPASYDFRREKPNGWDKKDKGEDNPDQSRARAERQMKLVQQKEDGSLFSMVAHRAKQLFSIRRGDWWLLCDDRSNEIADFILVVIDKAKPSGRLTLLHAKGGKGQSDDSGREISISNYETVVGQATKNLRHLDPRVLAQRLRNDARDDRPGVFMTSKRARAKDVDWTIDTGPFLEQLDWLAAHRGCLETGVVIFQPHQRQQLWDDIRNASSVGNGSAASRLTRPAYMLSTILLSAESYCANYNASLKVWGEADGARIRPSVQRRFGRTRTKPPS